MAPQLATSNSVRSDNLGPREAHPVSRQVPQFHRWSDGVVEYIQPPETHSLPTNKFGLPSLCWHATQRPLKWRSKTRLRLPVHESVLIQMNPLGTALHIVWCHTSEHHQTLAPLSLFVKLYIVYTIVIFHPSLALTLQPVRIILDVFSSNAWHHRSNFIRPSWSGFIFVSNPTVSFN